MLREDIKEAVNSGHKSSSILTDVLRVLAKDHHCPSADGFEGPETYTDCGVCTYCIAKEMLSQKEI